MGGGDRSTLRKPCLIAAMSQASLAVWLGIDLVFCGERLTTNCLDRGTKAWRIFLITLRVYFWGHIVHDSLLWWYRAMLTEVHFGSHIRYCMWRAQFCSSAQMAGARLPVQLNYALWFLIFVGCLWNVLPVAPGFCRNMYTFCSRYSTLHVFVQVFSILHSETIKIVIKNTQTVQLQGVMWFFRFLVSVIIHKQKGVKTELKLHKLLLFFFFIMFVPCISNNKIPLLKSN
jgi:hypothetical protein